MNAPTNKTRAVLIATLLLGLGASALADSSAPVQPTMAPLIVPALPLGQSAPGVRPTPPAPGQMGTPGQPGPRGGHGPRGAGPGGTALCTPGAGMAMRPAPSGQGGVAQPGMQKALKGNKIDKGMRLKDKGMGKGGKGKGCPPALKGMAQGAPRPGAAAPGQATSLVRATRDLGRLNALSAQTSDSRIRGYLNDARTYLQSAGKAQQKAGRDLLHAAEALIQGVQTPQR